MRTSASNSDRGRKMSLTICLPSNNRSWRDEVASPRPKHNSRAEYTCPPAPWKSAATSAGGGERYSMECAHHGWHHEPHSPVKNTMCKRWDTPEEKPCLLLPGTVDEKCETEERFPDPGPA